MKSSPISLQPYEVLERRLANWAGYSDPKLVVACSSGTAALHLALESMDLQEGMEVLLPDFTMVACARAVTLAGLIPVFVPCGDDLLVTPEILARVIRQRQDQYNYRGTCAAMMVHVYGRECDMAGIHRVLEEHFSDALMVIEDLAEAHGVTPHHLTDAACWSFYKNKVVAGEEGGAVAFKSTVHAERGRKLRSLGFTDDHDFTHIPRGHNYRMSNAHASLVLSSLDRYGFNLGKRMLIEHWYNTLCPVEWKMPPRDVPWVYDLRIRGMSADLQNRLVKGLNENGIPARHGFKPMSSQPEYRGKLVYVGNSADMTAAYSKEVIYLPINPEETTQIEVSRAFDVMGDIL